MSGRLSWYGWIEGWWRRGGVIPLRWIVAGWWWTRERVCWDNWCRTWHGRREGRRGIVLWRRSRVIWLRWAGLGWLSERVRPVTNWGSVGIRRWVWIWLWSGCHRSCRSCDLHSGVWNKTQYYAQNAPLLAPTPQHRGRHMLFCAGLPSRGQWYPSNADEVVLTEGVLVHNRHDYLVLINYLKTESLVPHGVASSIYVRS